MARSPTVPTTFYFEKHGELLLRPTVVRLPKPMDPRTEFAAFAQTVVASCLPVKKMKIKDMIGFGSAERFCFFCSGERYLVGREDVENNSRLGTFLDDVKPQVRRAILSAMNEYKYRFALMVWPWGRDFGKPAKFREFYNMQSTVYVALLAGNAVVMDPLSGKIFRPQPRRQAKAENMEPAGAG